MLRTSRWRGLIAPSMLAAILVGQPARADGPAPARADTPAPGAPADPPAPPSAPPPPVRDLSSDLRALVYPVDADWHLLGAIEFGRGFRFNNPFRLATELGNGPESVSLIAPYADLGLAFSYGPPDGIQHGVALHTSVTMNGVFGAAIAPGYQLTYRGPRPFLAYGRVGPIIGLTPDPDLGVEVAGGFAWFLTGHLAVASELVFDVWWGAGTHQVAVATYPVLAGQLGILVDYELLP
jgi:hypothetical protein